MDGEGTSGKALRDHFTTKASTVLYPVQGSLKRPNVFNVVILLHVYIHIFASTAHESHLTHRHRARRGGASWSQAISSPAAGRCAVVDRGVLKQTSPCRVWLVSSSPGNLPWSPSIRFAQQMDSDLPTIFGDDMGCCCYVYYMYLLIHYGKAGDVILFLAWLAASSTK